MHSVFRRSADPVLNTPQGRLQFSMHMMQWGNATPQMALQVAQSGNLGPAVDPAKGAARGAWSKLDLEGTNGVSAEVMPPH